MTTEKAIDAAIRAVMMEMEGDGLPSHVYVRLPRRVSREHLNRAAEACQAWVREYDGERFAIVACR